MRNAISIPLTALVFCLVQASARPDSLVLENAFLARELRVQDGHLETARLHNKLAAQEIVPNGGGEFRLRLSEGTETTGTDITADASDFEVLFTEVIPNEIIYHLENKDLGIQVEVHYTLASNKPYGHKYLVITASHAVTLERADIESLRIDGAYQPYTLNDITTTGKWSPGLGQPLYTAHSATFWGVEFPAARNTVDGGTLRCAYLWGKALTPGVPYTTHKAVFGAGDAPEFIEDAFQDYINDIRVRPLRLQVQYNTWFDCGGRVDTRNFAHAVSTIHEELVEKRACPPLNAYVIDSGWQASRNNPPFADWTQQLYPVNPDHFATDLDDAFTTAEAAQSRLGLWLSPACLMGCQPNVPILGAAGYEALGKFSMSMAGPKYMAGLEERVCELARMGCVYFKFDGIFGHLLTRAFELEAGRGVPVVPQLGTEGFTSTDERLNAHEFDEAKMYYLTAGAERFIEILDKLAAINPDVFIALTNGAFLSPWWLQHADVVWLINAGDSAHGSGRTAQLTYRDGIYYEIWQEERTQFPLNAIFNHEPKKIDTGESREEFKDYLLMCLSRGTGFLELYIKTDALASQDWDVLSEGIQWAHRRFPAFQRARMHGGNPIGPKGGSHEEARHRQGKADIGRDAQVYGYTGWNESMGYVSLHNPSAEKRGYTFTLDRSFGLLPGTGPFTLSSPAPEKVKPLKKHWGLGDTIEIELDPREILILEFDAIEAE